MTISDYLKNPYGKGSAFSSSKKQQEDLDKKYPQLSKNIISKIYRYRDNVIYHIIVPSEKSNVNYDVVIEIETKRLHEGDATLENLDFKAFSNCPSFIFTFAHVFRGNNMLCEWLISKYNPEVRLKAPSQRNPYGIVGLEKSIYLALKHLHVSGKTRFGVYQTSGKKVNGRTEIINSVRSQQQIMDKVREKISTKQNDNDQDSVSPFGQKSLSRTKLKEKKKSTKMTILTKSIKKTQETKTLKRTKKGKTTKKI